MSDDLKEANRSSQGAALYEWGPVKSTGIYSRLNIFIACQETWQDALSKRTTVFKRHPGYELSSFLTRSVKNKSRILLLLLPWTKLKQTFPLVSRPVIKLTLGDIWAMACEFVVLGACHFIRLKSPIPSQVSSTLRMIRPEARRWINSNAKRYLKTRFFSELACIDT